MSFVVWDLGILILFLSMAYYLIKIQSFFHGPFSVCSGFALLPAIGFSLQME